MEKEQFERRKKVINDLMHDKTYVPMKIKELAMVLGVSREKEASWRRFSMSWSAKERSKFPSGANIRSPRAIFSQENTQLM